MNCLFVRVRNNFRADFAIALMKTHHGCFTKTARAMNLLLARILVHIFGETAYKRFVYLNCASKFFKRLGLHCFADSLFHKPSGRLRHFQIARDFVSTDSVLRVRDHPKRGEPLIQTQRGVLENSSDLDAELLFAIKAFPNAPRRKETDVLALASRASRITAPSQVCHEL
jgi:hypothetical protein